MQNTNWRKDLNELLMNYRATPHSATKISPAEFFLGRNIKTRLPQVSVPNESLTNKIAKENDTVGKQYMKQYADVNRNVKQNTFKVEDNVRVLQKVTSKFMKDNLKNWPFLVIIYKIYLIIKIRKSPFYRE
jgi:hypothetical protein